MGSNDSEQLRTVFVGNIANGTSEDHLYELFLQAGPLDYVKIPVDRTTKVAKNFAFVCYRHECSVPYAIHLLNNINLSGRNIRVQARENRDAVKDVNIVGIHSLDPDFKVTKVSERKNDIDRRLSYGNETSLLGAPPLPPLIAHNPYLHMDPSQANLSYRNNTNLYMTEIQKQQNNSYNYSYYNNANNYQYSQGLASVDTHSMNYMKNTYNENYGSNQNYSRRNGSDRSQNYNNSYSDDRSYRNRHSSDRNRDSSHYRSDEYRNSSNRNNRNRPYDKYKDGNSHGSRY